MKIINALVAVLMLLTIGVSVTSAANSPQTVLTRAMITAPSGVPILMVYWNEVANNVTIEKYAQFQALDENGRSMIKMYYATAMASITNEKQVIVYYSGTNIDNMYLYK